MYGLKTVTAGQRAQTMQLSNEVIKTSGIAFGTSGARGLVTDFKPEVCAAFTHAFSSVIQKKYSFSTMIIGIDRRPSSHNIAMSCAAALIQCGIEPIYCGVLPTPALAYSAMQGGVPAIMVTGSHIPFDRNGLKFYTPEGEIGKDDEREILSIQSPLDFNPKVEPMDLNISEIATTQYIKRYQSIAPSNALAGKRIGIYEHSSAGREIYGKLFKYLGASVVSLGRSDEFVPIDTEAVSIEDHLKARSWSNKHKLDAIFSTDGDGDRPLVADESGNWLRGDILGLICAKLLGIEGISVPINCNTSIELSGAFKKVARTRIGSPYVIDAFHELKNKYKTVAGFEANGGFLLASDVLVNNEILQALPTRDALLPAIILLASPTHCKISDMLKLLPVRFTASDRLKNFPIEVSRDLIERASADPTIFLAKLGITTQVRQINLIDGLRIHLANSNIIHLRPSGNAPELRCYSEATTDEEAREIVTQVLSELKKMV